MKNNKAPGLDMITSEMLKSGDEIIIKRLTFLYNLCIKNGIVPKEWTKGMIVKLPKKGNLSECSNWWGITLLSVPGKLLCSVLLHRLGYAIDSQIREE